MAKNYTQQSNNTGLSVAREVSLGVLPPVPVWGQREPNSYKTFGPDFKQKTRSPINASRQQQKGVVVDLDASGGWQEDLTYPALSSFAEAIMFAAYRRKGDLAVTGVSAAAGYAVAGGDVYKTGDILFGNGFSVPGNNGRKILLADGTAGDVQAPGLADEADALGSISKVGHQFALGDLSLVADGAFYLLESAAKGLGALGVIPGETVFIGGDGVDGFASHVGGYCRIASVAADGSAAVLDKMQFPGVDAGAGRSVIVYLGRVIKNESDPNLIVRYTHHLERTLGKDDTTSANQQAEYIKGAVVDQWSMPLNTADKVTMDFTLQGTRYSTVTSEVGPYAGTRPPLQDGDAFTTSNDIPYSALHVVGDADPLYAYLTDISLSVDNNVKGNKALGVLGSFDLSYGNFVVSANANAYFADVTAQEAIINNDNVTFTFALARSNQGIVVDIPLASLGDGKPKVASNEPITLALDISAARASLLSPLTDYTLMMVFFDYLPNVAHGAQP